MISLKIFINFYIFLQLLLKIMVIIFEDVFGLENIANLSNKELLKL